MEKMKGNRVILYTLFTAGVGVWIFCVRRGWERPFFALTDALFVGGIVGSAVAVIPRIFASDSFDGFAYALRFTVFGLIPSRMKSYSAFKKERKEKRICARESDFAWTIPVGCLVLGSLLSLFFL